MKPLARARSNSLGLDRSHGMRAIVTAVTSCPSVPGHGGATAGRRPAAREHQEMPMTTIHSNSELRALDDRELDAVSGGVTAYDGLRAVGQIIEKTATLGAAIIIGVARSAIKSAG
jgi:hypothetical protein